MIFLDRFLCSAIKRLKYFPYNLNVVSRFKRYSRWGAFLTVLLSDFAKITTKTTSSNKIINVSKKISLKLHSKYKNSQKGTRARTIFLITHNDRGRLTGAQRRTRNKAKPPCDRRPDPAGWRFCKVQQELCWAKFLASINCHTGMDHRPPSGRQSHGLFYKQKTPAGKPTGVLCSYLYSLSLLVA